MLSISITKSLTPIALFLCALLAGCSSPHSAEHHLRKARDHFGRSEPARAKQQIDKAINSDIQREQTYWTVMRLYAHEEHYVDAAHVGELLLQRAGPPGRDEISVEDRAQLYVTIGTFYKLQDELPAAEAAYKSALALAPDSPELLNTLGYFYADEGIRLHEALDLTARAVRLAPNSPHIIDSLGWAHYRLGDYRAALDNLTKAVEMMPDSAELRYHLGAAYAKRGQTLAAWIELKKALILDPELKEADQLLKIVHK